VNVSVKGGVHILVTFEDVFEPLFFVFPFSTLEGFESFFGRGLTSWEVSFPPFCGVSVHCLLEFSSSSCSLYFCTDCVPPDFLSVSWWSSGLLFLFMRRLSCHWGGPIGALVCICLDRLCCALTGLVPLWSRRLRSGFRPCRV
jgi:hypothetical protein